MNQSAPDGLPRLEALERRIWEETPEQLHTATTRLSRELLAELSDESLALAIQKGFRVQETFTELFVTRYGPYLARWLFRWGTECHQTLDLIQQLYLRFYERRLESYRPSASFRAYLYRSAYHLWIQFVSRPRKLTSLADLGEPLSLLSSPEQQLLDQEAAARIDEAIEQLRPQERLVVEATMAGHNADTIAQTLGLRKEQVFRYLFRGRRHLEQILQIPPRKNPSPTNHKSGREVKANLLENPDTNTAPQELSHVEA